ncbi:MAG TPA: phosphoribosyl-ATP diphosphatase [Rhodospirillaceae bacterium]|nr:phosphoribosyl-ATP diphosphatase [Rhodospirillaceae bacterium]
MSADNGKIIDQLFATIVSRKGGDPEKSYTARLLSRGPRKVAQKLGEEAVETVIAGLTEGPERLVSESADLLYHLLVFWAISDVTPDQIWAELQKRKLIGGLDEKKARKS